MSVNAHTIGLATVMRNSIILAVLRAHFSATCAASILGVSSPIKTTSIVEMAVAEIVAITVGWPPPTVLIANDVPTEATRMLNKFPTRRIVPKNLSCSPKILITYFAFWFPLSARCLIRYPLDPIRATSVALMKALPNNPKETIMIEVIKLNGYQLHSLLSVKFRNLFFKLYCLKSMP